jgi:hypothetical protein
MPTPGVNVWPGSRTIVNAGAGVNVGVTVGVFVGVNVFVGVGVLVGVLVGVFVGVFVLVGVGGFVTVVCAEATLFDSFASATSKKGSTLAVAVRLPAVGTEPVKETVTEAPGASEPREQSRVPPVSDPTIAQLPGGALIPLYLKSLGGLISSRDGLAG